MLLNILRTENDINHALTVLPRTLFETYDRLLESIDQKYAGLVKRALFLVIHKHTDISLSLKALVQGIATINEDLHVNWSSTFLELQLLIQECGALLLGCTDTSNVEPCHYTVGVSKSHFPDNSLVNN